MQQLPLALKLRSDGGFADYLAGPNAEPVKAIAAWAAGEGERFLYLFGPSGSGKTHLLQAACRSAAERSEEVVYLPLAEFEMRPAVLEGLELAGFVALDDLHAVAADADWERSLFGLYNRLRETGGRLLVGARPPLAELPIVLPDLRSRLGWGPGYRLRPLSDEDSERLLLHSAKRRGLELGTDVVGYIMRRSPRDAGSLLGLLDSIDQESLRKKCRPTLWLVRQILEGSE